MVLVKAHHQPRPSTIVQIFYFHRYQKQGVVNPCKLPSIHYLIAFAHTSCLSVKNLWLNKFNCCWFVNCFTSLLFSTYTFHIQSRTPRSDSVDSSGFSDWLLLQSTAQQPLTLILRRMHMFFRILCDQKAS